MKTAQRLIFSLAVVLILVATITVFPVPVAHGSAYAGALPQNPPPRLVGKQITTSGTISSVQQYAFVLDVTKPKKDSLPFFTYDTTKVEGDLKVGAKADVTYQKDDQGNLVALTVHINS